MKKLTILFLLVVSGIILKGETTDIAKYKSMFTLNFMRYVGWPDETKDGDFVIGVLKNSQIADQLLAQTAGKKYGFQNIVVKEFKSIEEVSNCHILFVSGNINYTKNADAIAERLNKKYALIITDNHGAIAKGSMINFVIINDQLKFEVSVTNAEKHGLKLSNTLLAMNNAIRS